MKNPDFGQGIGDLATQIKLMLMMQNLMPQGGQPKFGGAGAVGQPGQPIDGSIGGAMGQGSQPSMYGPDSRREGSQPSMYGPDSRREGMPSMYGPEPSVGSSAGGAGANPLSNMDPKMLMMIMQAIRSMRGGVGMG